MKCNKCGNALKDGQAVCPKCSAQQDRATQMVSLSQMSSRPPKKRRKPLTVKQLIIRIAIIALAALAAVGVAIFSILYIYVDTNIQQEGSLSGDIAVNTELPEGVINIALFGLDSRRDNDSGRSDAMIILSIDKTHNKIKLTSLARDTLVPIDGHGKSKLTHAWAFGKANLSVKTINQNFGMNITDYAYVNFFEFAEIIDYIGGVNIDVSSSEMYVMNNTYVSWIQSYGIKCPRITQTGMQTLNGGQALAYARNRYTGSDIERGDRQKEVLEAMFTTVKDLPLTKFPALISKILGMCHTSLTSTEMMNIASWALTSNPSFERYSLPNSKLNAWGGSTAWYGWVYVYDMNLATALLHDFIYETETDLSTIPRVPTHPADTSVNKKKTTTTRATTTTKKPVIPSSSFNGTTSTDMSGPNTDTTIFDPTSSSDSTTSTNPNGPITPNDSTTLPDGTTTDVGDDTTTLPVGGTTASTSSTTVTTISPAETTTTTVTPVTP